MDTHNPAQKKMLDISGMISGMMSGMISYVISDTILCLAPQVEQFVLVAPQVEQFF
jgi:hypothetical protein